MLNNMKMKCYKFKKKQKRNRGINMSEFGIGKGIAIFGIWLSFPLIIWACSKWPSGSFELNGGVLFAQLIATIMVAIA